MYVYGVQGIAEKFRKYRWIFIRFCNIIKKKKTTTSFTQNHRLALRIHAPVDRDEKKTQNRPVCTYCGVIMLSRESSNMLADELVWRWGGGEPKIECFCARHAQRARRPCDYYISVYAYARASCSCGLRGFGHRLRVIGGQGRYRFSGRTRVFIVLIIYYGTQPRTLYNIFDYLRACVCVCELGEV